MVVREVYAIRQGPRVTEAGNREAGRGNNKRTSRADDERRAIRARDRHSLIHGQGKRLRRQRTDSVRSPKAYAVDAGGGWGPTERAGSVVVVHKGHTVRQGSRLAETGSWEAGRGHGKIGR